MGLVLLVGEFFMSYAHRNLVVTGEFQSGVRRTMGPVPAELATYSPVACPN
jgi:hypothetical protein